MPFDAFDEGIALGGIRSKNEIRILICYLYNSVNDSMSKSIVLEAIMAHELANYFEISSAFDDLVTNNNLKVSGTIDGETTYALTENGKTIATELEATVSRSVKEKAYICAVRLLSERKTARENHVEIISGENGCTVNCKISGGDTELMSFSLYAPDYEQAQIMKKSFLSNPSAVYKTMLGLLTRDRENVGEALEEVYADLS